MAVEEGEVRFSQAYNFAKERGPISKKTVAKILKGMVKEHELEMTISKITGRRAYKASETGAKHYAIEQVFSLLQNFLVRYSQTTGFKIENLSFDDLITVLEMFGKGLAFSLIASITALRSYAEVCHEKQISIIADLMGEAYSKFLCQIGLNLIKREDFDQKSKELIEKYNAEYEKLKGELLKIKPEVLSVPEVSACENILKNLIRNEGMQRNL
jgi:hypothetical protein